ncbi:MAG TPA: CAP domain-containing protein [Solirubrobacteraceae bacterium]|nr:CAP domain-containing protein [Solirubrobacteraceae bacterium]
MAPLRPIRVARSLVALAACLGACLAACASPLCAGALAARPSVAPSVARAARRAGGCAHARLMPARGDLRLVRAATLCLINRERVRHGERPLRANRRLQHAAQSHSTSMALDGYFEHVGPGGSSPLARMRQVGYVSSSRVGYEVGENIAWGTLSLATPSAIVASWMHSPAHRANILDPRYRDTGIGISPHVPSSLARGQAGAIYTQDFGVIIG